MGEKGKCAICHEEIERLDNGQWRHTHADKDVECWTGDGSTAMPSEDDLDFARETLGPEATDDEVTNLATLRNDRRD